jgi:hypothetical protein
MNSAQAWFAINAMHPFFTQERLAVKTRGGYELVLAA